MGRPGGQEGRSSALAQTQILALEEIMNIMGSKHRVKRNMIHIDPKNIKEVTNPDEIKDIYVRIFTTEDDLKIPGKE